MEKNKEVIKEKVNKEPKKRIVKKGNVAPSPETSNTNKILIENFVSFQKVMSNLSAKFDSLANQISKLLELFEMSAKALAEKDFDIEKNNKDNTKILEKIENVLEQNKTIARGLTLMHEKIESPIYPPQMPAQRILPPQRPPFRPVQPKTSVVEGISEEYHRPVSPEEQ